MRWTRKMQVSGRGLPSNHRLPPRRGTPEFEAWVRKGTRGQSKPAKTGNLQFSNVTDRSDGMELSSTPPLTSAGGEFSKLGLLS